MARVSRRAVARRLAAALALLALSACFMVPRSVGAGGCALAD